MDEEGDKDVVDPVAGATELDHPVGSPTVGQTPNVQVTSNANTMEDMMGTTGSSTDQNDNIKNKDSEQNKNDEEETEEGNSDNDDEDMDDNDSENNADNE